MSKFGDFIICDCKGVLLDLDNTLYDYQTCHIEALRTVYQDYQRLFGWSYQEFSEKYEEARAIVGKRLKGYAASHSRFLYFQVMTEKCFNRTAFDLVDDLETLYWQSFMEKMSLKSEAYDFLQECKSKNIQVCILTDLTAKLQFKKIRRLCIEDYIDYIVTSEESGVEKPDPKIFQLGLEKMNLHHDEVVVIGDDYAKDIKGAEQMKMRWILID